MFKEKMTPIEKRSEPEQVVQFSDWEEETAYVADKMATEKSEEIYSVLDKLVDERGEFRNFLKKENVIYFSKLMEGIVPNAKVKNGYGPDYKYDENLNEKGDGYDFAFTEALPILFQKNLDKGEHDKNLSILQAWSQTKSDQLSETERQTDARVIKWTFGESLKDKNISVLEKTFLNYLGRQFNQMDSDFMKNCMPEDYKNLKQEQPNIERFKKEIPPKFKVILPPAARSGILRDKFGFLPIAWSDRTRWDDDQTEIDLIRERVQQRKLPPEMEELYEKYSNDKERFNNFRASQEGQLSPCRRKINPMDLKRADGEYFIADFSPDYDGVYSLSGNLEAFIEKIDLKAGRSKEAIVANDFLDVKKEIDFYSRQDLAAFKVMSSLFFRDALEKSCGIDIAQLNLRTQKRFLEFIKNNSSDDLKKVKQFLDNSLSPEGNINRIQAFLCMEVDQGVGEVILNLGQKLKADQADLLFGKVAAINNSQEAEAVSRFYQELFFDKNVDEDKLTRASFSRARNLLVEANAQIEQAPGEELIVKNLIDNLEKEARLVKEDMEELKKMASQLNEKYNNLGQDLMIALDPEMDGYKQFEEGWLDKNNNLSSEMKNSVKAELVKHKKYDSVRLKEMLDYYKTVLKEDVYSISKDDQALEEFSQEKEKYEKGEINYEEFLRIIEKSNVIFYAPTAAEKRIYEEAIKKIQPILPLQAALEKKIDQIVYGHAELQLPKDFNNFDSEPVRPESIPDQTPLYFPVGISKDLPSWEAVLRGDKKAVKPVDLYGYLFWLNNQNRPVNLVICDEIQINNYAARYNKSETEARGEAIEIGRREAEQYQKIISTFGLDNIRLQGYPEFISQNKNEYQRYQKVVKNLAANPIFKEAFLAMVQESVSGAEKEEYIGYALEELAWILSANGTKVGHLNEARYDILGAVIRNWEKVGQEKGLDVLANPESAAAKIILNTVCKGLRDTINERKSKLDKDSSANAYFQRLGEHLGKIKIDPKMETDKSFKKDSLSLNFVCPDVGSASFGWRGDFEEKESVVKFKEPYSTYFYKTDVDLLINSDQVVAAGEGCIGGKILTLDSKKQLKYAESVVRPILKHYFVSLEKAPAEYFQTVGKNKEELREEEKETASLLEAIRFIQKYIIKPTELV